MRQQVWIDLATLEGDGLVTGLLFESLLFLLAWLEI
jgi:hypothetical protein